MARMGRGSNTTLMNSDICKLWSLVQSNASNSPMGKRASSHSSHSLQGNWVSELAEVHTVSDRTGLEAIAFSLKPSVLSLLRSL